ncbi:hypothetical protein HAX54_007005, partial [Datura stramonium]|nr:hypothetical protein [Datura stramonium]
TVRISFLRVIPGSILRNLKDSTYKDGGTAMGFQESYKDGRVILKGRRKEIQRMTNMAWE